MVCGGEQLSSVFDSAPQKSINLAKIFKNVCNNCKNAGLCNSSFGRVEKFKCLGTNLTNKHSIQEEIKSRLKSGNACCHSVQILLSSTLLSNNLKVKI
jgi:hypothetical protein